MLMVVLLCRRTPAQEHVEENRRRYSEPAMNYKHTNGELALLTLKFARPF